jgi:hypothetical protein
VNLPKITESLTSEQLRARVLVLSNGKTNLSEADRKRRAALLWKLKREGRL